MATSTPTLIDLVIAELKAHLPALLSAESLPAPATEDYLYGARELTPSTRTPQICVDVPDIDQEGAVGSAGKRSNAVLVFVVLSAPDEDTLHRYLHSYIDLVIKVLESEVASGTAQLVVTSGDTSPILRGGTALFRAASIEARLRVARNRGDS